MKAHQSDRVREIADELMSIDPLSPAASYGLEIVAIVDFGGIVALDLNRREILAQRLVAGNKPEVAARYLADTDTGKRVRDELDEKRRMQEISLSDFGYRSWKETLTNFFLRKPRRIFP